MDVPQARVAALRVIAAPPHRCPINNGYELFGNAGSDL
jgi:hypothetical protein